MLLAIQAVLEDAEEKQLTDKAVKLWLDNLRDLAYDVEDMLDEFAVEAMRCILKVSGEASTNQTERRFSWEKILIVLDDVWNKNYGEWNRLQPPFRAGAPGSKIIVTTRDSNVALLMGATKFHYLEQMSNDDCWSVFAQHAFENKDLAAQPNLEIIGRKIVKKCKGLPLAARTLGGLLRCKERDYEWEDILNSKLWSLSDEESEILPVLRLSYYHLPSHLKRCFSFCSVLPKDYEFEQKELVLLWMAEGLVQQPEENKQKEDIGGEYFCELLSRSLFQRSSRDQSKFVMHDLISDLAQWVAGDICFMLEDKVDGSKMKISPKARYSSYICGQYDDLKKFEAFSDAKV
ncbi:hypothetical protein GH714_005490 [Hevea brasiliensis]|uniref:NB-ARC domain-containing protein n=1 Tax=Hevea brasiliensis TaxID=3981 RepID=A0A6A6LZI1_HEVBR|nr:hypothetical protein GH714_005490 [Hevea brasiliensis]